MDATNSDSDAPELARVFAPMLSELEDHATRLTARQAEIARELAAVDEELARVESVRAAMLGKRGPGRPRGSGSGQPSPGAIANKQTRERAAMVMDYARAHAGEFSGRAVADHLGMKWQGIGPTLAGMARRGELDVRDDEGGQRLYSLPS
jgi:hypothetical protein